MFERVVARQLMAFLERNNLLPSRQSGFRPDHSTETVVFRVLSDILAAVDRGDLAALVLLDISAAFDNVNHIVYFWNVYGGRSILLTAHTRGCLSNSLAVISVFVISVFVMSVPFPDQSHWDVASHEDRSSVRSCSCCTLPTYKRSSSGVGCHRISTPTIVRFAASAGLMKLERYRKVSST